MTNGFVTLITAIAGGASQPRRNVLPNSAARAAGLDRYGRPKGRMPMSRFFDLDGDDVSPATVKDRLSESGYHSVQGIWRISRGGEDCFVATAYAHGRQYRVFADPKTGRPFARTRLQEF